MTRGIPDIQVRSWIKANNAERRTGLIGYLSVLYGGMVFDGLTLRRTADGRFTLSFPAKTDRSGRRHAYIRPVDDTSRRVIERAILGQLGQREDLGIAEEASHD